MDVSEGFAIPALLLLTRWSHFASVFALFGAASFWAYTPGAFPGARRATNILLRVAAPAAALSGLGWIAAMVANMADGFDKIADPQTLSLFFTQTQFGPVVEIRLALLALALAFAAWPMAAESQRRAMVALGAALLIDQAWLGHAAEGSGAWGAFMLAVYCGHVLAAAAWLGGLPPLLFALSEASGQGEEAARRQRFEILKRFSLVALPAAAMIVASGLGNAGFRVGASFERVFLTDYGSVLSAKAALVAVMLALASYNRFVAQPRLRRAPPSPRQGVLLHASVALELALGLAVLAAAALLGVTPPPQ
jgi:putative copper resistance protein D